MQKAVEPPVKTVLVWATDTRSGVRYQEERQIRYDSETDNYKVLQSRRTGWKILPGESEPVPTRKKRPNGTGRASKKVAASSAETTTQAKRRRTGATDLIDWAAKKIRHRFESLDSLPRQRSDGREGDVGGILLGCHRRDR